MQTCSTFNLILVLRSWSLRKNELTFFLLNFLSQFIDMYRTDTVFSLILLIRAKVEAHFIKKLGFVTNKSLKLDSFGKCPRIAENLSKYTALQLSQNIVVYTIFLLISYILQRYPSK